MAQDVADGGCAGIEVGCGVVVQQGKTDGWEAVEAGFKHRPDSAAVDDVDRSVAAIVDTREYQVGGSRTEMLDTHLYAVGRCAVA